MNVRKKVENLNLLTLNPLKQLLVVIISINQNLTVLYKAGVSRVRV